MESLAAFRDRLVGQADHLEPGQAGSNLALHLYPARFQPEIGDRPNQCDQADPRLRLPL